MRILEQEMKRLAQSERLNNRSLGLSGASRNGTKLAITPEHYRDVLEMARIKAPGLAAVLALSRLLGLRSQRINRCRVNATDSLVNCRPC